MECFLRGRRGWHTCIKIHLDIYKIKYFYYSLFKSPNLFCYLPRSARRCLLNCHCMRLYLVYCRGRVYRPCLDLNPFVLGIPSFHFHFYYIIFLSNHERCPTKISLELPVETFKIGILLFPLSLNPLHELPFLLVLLYLSRVIISYQIFLLIKRMKIAPIFQLVYSKVVYRSLRVKMSSLGNLQPIIIYQEILHLFQVLHRIVNSSKLNTLGRSLPFLSIGTCILSIHISCQINSMNASLGETKSGKTWGPCSNPYTLIIVQLPYKKKSPKLQMNTPSRYTTPSPLQFLILKILTIFFGSLGSLTPSLVTTFMTKRSKKTK